MIIVIAAAVIFCIIVFSEISYHHD